MSELKIEFTLPDYITFHGQRYEVSIAPVKRSAFYPCVESVAKQILLTPVPDAPPPTANKQEQTDE